jgi:hypothetical protein
LDNSNEDKMHTIWRQNGDNEALKWYLDDGWAIWIIWTWDAKWRNEFYKLMRLKHNDTVSVNGQCNTTISI